jgi:hypothetical protein
MQQLSRKSRSVNGRSGGDLYEDVGLHMDDMPRPLDDSCHTPSLTVPGELACMRRIAAASRGIGGRGERRARYG